jgi:2-polyprenyl-3-methyl-5-hydroxy-6-metoxy-1,4-benzoquinol methylase
MDSELTDRQRREREFYEQYSSEHADLTTTFDPVAGDERRPWNSYWYVYDQVRSLCNGGGRRLLDFGCGSGVASTRYASLGYEVHGFDICRNNVHLAQRRAERYGFADRTNFEVQIAENLDYPDDHFHVVAGIDIIHHVEIEPAMREVRRVLKPGGVGLFREWIEVPVFESVRNTALVRRFFPKEMSFEGHRTHDERKLNTGDVATIRRVFPGCRQVRFCIFSRLRRVLPIRDYSRPSRLERLDRALMRACPPLSRFGGEVVFVVRKSTGEHSSSAQSQ